MAKENSSAGLRGGMQTASNGHFQADSYWDRQIVKNMFKKRKTYE